MKIRFFYKGQQREVDPDEFIPKLHRAVNDYACERCRIATHLVLGENEFADFQACVAHFKSSGHIRDDRGVKPTTFCGLIILRSAVESLVMAVNQVDGLEPAK